MGMSLRAASSFSPTPFLAPDFPGLSKGPLGKHMSQRMPRLPARQLPLPLGSRHLGGPDVPLNVLGALPPLTPTTQLALSAAPFLDDNEGLVRITGTQTLPKGHLPPGLVSWGLVGPGLCGLTWEQWGLCFHVSWNLPGGPSLCGSGRSFILPPVLHPEVTCCSAAQAPGTECGSWLLC